MKKLLLSITVLAAMFCSGKVSGQCTAYYDDFESGMVSANYIPAGGTFTRGVDTTASPQGIYHMYQTGSGNHFQGCYFTFPSGTPGSISFYINTSTVSQHNAYFVIGDPSITSNFGTIFIYVYANNGLRFYANSTTAYLAPISANTWYHVELKNISYTAFTYDIWINGTQQYVGMPFRNNTTTIDRVYMYNLGSATARYDEIIVDGNLISPNMSGFDPTCAGDSNGTISTNPGGTPQHSYIWSTGDTTASLTGLPAGTYALTVTDSLGCTGSDSVVLTEPAPIAASYLLTDVTCPGGNDGSIDMTTSGGTSPYNFMWASGDSTEDISNLIPGDYMVDVTDSNGCMYTDTVSITGPAAWNVQFAVTDVSCYGDTNGSINSTVSGATPGYTYNWSTGDSTAMVSGLMPGSYSVVIMDSMGCSYGDTLQINEPLPIGGSGLVASDTSGNATGSIDLTLTGGTTPYTFSWSNGDSTEDISGLSAGTYFVTVTDANGCVYTDSFVVDLFVSIGQPYGDIAVTAYPVPGRDFVNLDFITDGTGMLNLQVYDLQGKTVSPVLTGINPKETYILDIRSLPAGIYILKVSGEGLNFSHRLVKY